MFEIAATKTPNSIPQMIRPARLIYIFTDVSVANEASLIRALKQQFSVSFEDGAGVAMECDPGLVKGDPAECIAFVYGTTISMNASQECSLMELDFDGIQVFQFAITTPQSVNGRLLVIPSRTTRHLSW